MNLPERIIGELMRVVVVAICAGAFAISIAEQTVPGTHDRGVIAHLVGPEHGQPQGDAPETPFDHPLHVDHCAHGHAVFSHSVTERIGQTQIAGLFPLVPGMLMELSLPPETPPPIA